jgi:hypothetical protein
MKEKMSFVDGMPEDVQIVFTMQLIKEIAKNKSQKFNSYAEKSKLSETLGFFGNGSSQIYTDPVVEMFLRNIECFTDTIKSFNQRTSHIQAMGLGQQWYCHYPRVKSDAGDFLYAFMNNDIAGFSEFVLAVCDMTLTEIIEKAQKGLNHIQAGKSEKFYSVLIVSNCMAAGKGNYKDSSHFDVLTSFSADAIGKNLASSIAFALESSLPDDSDYRFGALIDTVILKELVILANEQRICTIPLAHDGQVQGKEIGSYLLGYRQALAAKGAAAYNLNFHKLKMFGGDSNELLELASHFPKSAARTLRGGAIEDALGL